MENYINYTLSGKRTFILQFYEIVFSIVVKIKLLKCFLLPHETFAIVLVNILYEINVSDMTDCISNRVCKQTFVY